MYGTWRTVDGLWLGPATIAFGIAFGIAMFRHLRRRVREMREAGTEERIGIGGPLGLVGITIGFVMLGIWILRLGLEA